MRTLITLTAAASLTLFTGCASTYSNLVSGSNLGAQEYQPAVLVETSHEGRYAQVLGVCRQVATNRQVTAAQEAQLKSLTGATEGAVLGASFGLQFSSLMKNAGMSGNTSRNIGVGLLTGLAISAASAFAKGAEDNASETKRVLLACLKRADPTEKYYRVIE